MLSLVEPLCRDARALILEADKRRWLTAAPDARAGRQMRRMGGAAGAAGGAGGANGGTTDGCGGDETTLGTCSNIARECGCVGVCVRVSGSKWHGEEQSLQSNLMYAIRRNYERN